MLESHRKVNILLNSICHFAVVFLAYNLKAFTLVAVEKVPQLNHFFKVGVLFEKVGLRERRANLRLF